MKPITKKALVAGVGLTAAVIRYYIRSRPTT